MKFLEILFWVLLVIIFYTYIGYGIVLYLLVLMKRMFIKKKTFNLSDEELPEVTLLIPAYNEKDYVAQKMKNTMGLNYPKEKLNVFWVTDGSDDGTNNIAEQYENVRCFHKNERKGKINAMNRVMPFVKTPISIFSDANTDLGKDSILHIVNCFADDKVGCVSGEKRIVNKDEDVAAGAGEGLYWKYESTLKKWDAELYSVVGAAGELFAVRTELFQEVEKDTLLDDFIVSLRIAMKGFTIQYDPEAYAIESASANVKEELKRKIRIAAGGIQSIIRLSPLLNPFKYGTLSFQYISHRVLRWTLAPVALPLIFLINLLLAYNAGMDNFTNLYTLLFYGQILFYAAALLGWYFENREIKVKLLFIPYYFFVMNYAVFLGFKRFLKGQQSVNWERAKRGS